MNDSRLNEVRQRLINDYEFREVGDWLRRGICPQCQKKELYTNAVKPLVIRCGRLNHCGYEISARELYSDIFDNFNKRYKPTQKNPTATADAYLELARGFDLKKIRGWYTQDKYWNPNCDKGTATVRFMIDRENDVFFERFVETVNITQDGETKPRNKNFRGAIGGRFWQAPGMTMEANDKVWLVEGILDAIALLQNGFKAIALLSCNNWKKTDFAKYKGVKWVVAFDSDKAGRDYSKKLYSKLTTNGLSVECAQLPQQHKKIDWNDASQRDILKPTDIEKYLYNGKLLVAETAVEKALAIYNKTGQSTFSLDFKNRLYWFELDLDKFTKEYGNLVDGNDGLDDHTAREQALELCGTLRELANCKPSFLYFQSNTITDESWYYAKVQFPHSGVSIKNTFTGSQMSAAGEFKKRLLSIAPGALFTGDSMQLNYIVRNQLHNIKVVKTVDFVGYSKEFGTYIYTDRAVKNGQVIDINQEDYFELGKESVKSLQNSIKIDIGHARNYRDDWPSLVHKAYGIKGLVAAAMWFGILFSEQIRSKQKSFPFLEIVGEAGAGKTTLVEFLWCLYGRPDEEGFDPSKATAAAISRKFAQVSNLPVCLIEADREENTAKSRKFDWEELKTAYNGRAVRSRGMKTGGNETYEPPFRGGIVISQNNAVSGSDAILQRIIHLHFDRNHHSPETKIASDEMASLGVDQLSHFLVLAAQSEASTLATFSKSVSEYEKRVQKLDGIKTIRIAKNHAQLMALVDCFSSVAKIGEKTVEQMHGEVIRLAVERQQAIGSDHPIVAQFWEIYEYLGPKVLNHSRDPQVIAIRMQEFISLAMAEKLQVPLLADLRNYLKGSKSRKFIESNKPISSCQVNPNSMTTKTVRCWCFENTQI